MKSPTSKTNITNKDPDQYQHVAKAKNTALATYIVYLYCRIHFMNKNKHDSLTRTQLGQVLTASHDGTAQLWSIDTGACAELCSPIVSCLCSPIVSESCLCLFMKCIRQYKFTI